MESKRNKKRIQEINPTYPLMLLIMTCYGIVATSEDINNKRIGIRSQQQQQRVGSIRSPSCVFTMRVSSALLFRFSLLTFIFIVVWILFRYVCY